MTFTIKIFRAQEAHTLRCTDEFVSQWQSLAATTTHVTVFQEPAFVNCWYQQYSPEFEPVIVCGYDSNDQLIGFLPLAIEVQTRVLSHAAAQQVEYSGWLCRPEYKNVFISNAVSTVRKQINYTAWSWSHIPPGAEVDWLLQPGSELNNIVMHYEKVLSPVLDLHNEEKIKKIKKSKSVKSKINRLKRMGNLHLEHITEINRARNVMDLIPDLVNFRHGAAHGDLAFREDPLQHGFYQARANNLVENHFTALWMGDTLLAFHFGGVDNNTVYIGLTAFDPRHSKHSPGVILILYLSELLLQQGIQYIDLTPGGDEYKERFSNDHHTLYRPIVYPGRAAKTLHLLKQASRTQVVNTLAALGIDKKSLLNRFAPANRQTGKQKYHTFVLDLEHSPELPAVQAPEINVQRYHDLLTHQHGSNSLQMQSLLNDATQRFAKEETLITLMNENRLMAYGWISKIGANYKNHGLEINMDEDTLFIDCMDINGTLPATDKLQDMLSFMINYVADLNARKIYTCLPANANTNNQALITRFGLQPV